MYLQGQQRDSSPSSPTKIGGPSLLTRGCSPGNPFFTRARKSYAPTARNRRRSSSAHQSPAKIKEVSHKITEDKKPTKNKHQRPRAHSTGPPAVTLTKLQINTHPSGDIEYHNSNKTLTHSCSLSIGSGKSKLNIVKAARFKTSHTVQAKSISVPITSTSGTISMHSSPARRSNTMHPPYREVLIM